MNVNPILSAKAISIYLLFVLVGFACALVLPTMSLYFAKELGVRPLLVGLPYAGIAIASMVYNHFIGHWSDGVGDRRPLIAAFCVIGALACGILAITHLYWVAAITVVLLLSLAMVSFSQMLAYSLDFADAHIPVGRLHMFNAVVRAQIAIAWVVGPPAGFLLASFMGFATLYWCSASLFLLIGVLTFVVLKPLAHKQLSQETGQAAGLSSNVKWALGLSLAGFSLMWGANNAYLIAMPLYLQDGLGISSGWVGWVMGTCALLEIPFMILTGFLASRLPSIKLILIAGIAALMLYLGVLMAQNLWHMLVLQAFNACFIGVLAGLGVSVIQKLLPGRSGLASGLYTNTSHLGSLISSLLIAGVADVLGYKMVFWANGIIILMALLAFWRAGSAKLAPTEG